MEYAKYLALDQLLSAQQLQSEVKGRVVHDEHLFIIVHQAHELWFKQILFELDSIIGFFQKECLCDKEIADLVARLGRIVSIQRLLIQQIEVLNTMTPMDFLEFRHLLTPASGFQSQQFRELESKLGVNQEAGCLFDLVADWLARTPFLSANEYSFWQDYQQAVLKMMAYEKQVLENNDFLTDNDKKARINKLQTNKQHFNALFDEEAYEELVTQKVYRLSFRAMSAALFIFLYREQPILHLPHQLLANLLNIDELLTSWRYRHVLLVERMIGAKMGSGGSAGVHYLKTTLDKGVFADLAALSTYLVPRHMLPELPESFQQRLGYQYQMDVSS